jgi:hypothetical protein
MLKYVCFAAADPEFGFCGKLKDKKGKTKRKLELKCKVDDPNAKVKWFKDGKEIKQSDPRYVVLQYTYIKQIQYFKKG